MRKLLLSLTLLSAALLSPPSSRAQFVVVGQACGASGLNAIANDGTPVVCRGNPLVWTGTGGTPGGTNGQVQYNNNGAFGGTSGLTWNGSQLLSANGLVSAPSYSFSGFPNAGLAMPGGTLSMIFNGTSIAAFNASGITVQTGVLFSPELVATGSPTARAGDVSYGIDSTTVTPNFVTNNGAGVTSFTGAWNCVNVTPVTVNANVSTDQNLMTCSVPAGTLNRVGRTLRIWLSGIYSTPAASTTAVVIKAKLGSLTLATWTSTALAGIQATNDQFNVTAWNTTQTAGATAAFEVHGNMTVDLGVGNTVADSTFADVNTATVSSIDTTATQTLQITIAFTVASASNTATERQLILETIN